MKNLIYIMVFLMGSLAYGNQVVLDGLEHFWGFEDEKNPMEDDRGNLDGQAHGKIQHVPVEFSYTFNDVIHLHGNLERQTFIRIPNENLNQNSWSLEFWFGYGVHSEDLENQEAEWIDLGDGTVFEWGDIRVTYIYRTDQPDNTLLFRIDGREYTLDVDIFTYYQVVINYNERERGYNIWVDSVNYKFFRASSDIVGPSLVFGGNGFSGRFNDVKFYNRTLKGWEIVQNFYAKRGLVIEPKGKLVTTWGRIKHEVGN